jgi:REP element-mobilizing transposase RayT
MGGTRLARCVADSRHARFAVLDTPNNSVARSRLLGGRRVLRDRLHDRPRGHLGDVIDGTLRLNDAGNIVSDAWDWLPTRYPYVSLDEWCVMSDHLHGILVMGARADMGGSRAAPTGDGVETEGDAPALRRKPLNELIGAFKTVSTKHVNLLRNTPGAVVWQRDFWDHVVRDDVDLHRIREYIRDNGGCRGGS